MKKPKSKTLQNLLFNFKAAQFSNENPEIEVDQIVEFKNADALTRRKFVVDVAKFGLLTGIVGTSILSCKKEKDTENFNLLDKGAPLDGGVKVAIIGAGIAGLNAAYQLKKAGIQATVYEGSHRLGGRILTHYNDALQMGIQICLIWQKNSTWN
jgi:monoamine oxidase